MKKNRVIKLGELAIHLLGILAMILFFMHVRERVQAKEPPKIEKASSLIKSAAKLDKKPEAILRVTQIKELIKPVEVSPTPSKPKTTPKIVRLAVQNKKVEPKHVQKVDRAYIVEYTRNYAASVYGWTGEQWSALHTIVMKESGFNPNAQNPRSTAYGIYQFLNATWKSYGCTKSADYKVQTTCGLKYIKMRYGSPLQALAHHNEKGWY